MRHRLAPSSSVVTLSRRRLAFCAVAAVAALVVGFGAAKLFGPQRTHRPPVAAAKPPATSQTPAQAPKPGPAAAPPNAAQPTAGAASVVPTALPTVSFADRRSGFQVSYPRAWSRLSSHTAGVPLLVSSHDGVALQVQALEFKQPVDGRRLAAERDIAGAVIRSKPGAKIIAGPRLLAVSSLPGFLYVYSFYDPLSHRRVAHSQIALFAGRRMYTLVFQTARADDLPGFAMVIDKITASFRAI